MDQENRREHPGAASNEPAFDGDVLIRARAEFLEMPGLHLTERQAARLWGCSHSVSEAVLAHLTGSRFLIRTRNGSFARG